MAEYDMGFQHLPKEKHLELARKGGRNSAYHKNRYWSLNPPRDWHGRSMKSNGNIIFKTRSK